ncbi:DUF397 domain-containing protein [Saccharothrix violaceirubra]|uniref:DUF397 domain-containing protein n=1 Tax=Saccharothrix violaceirubra TaxID=413306 RepID=A0A7W7WZT8_9PSEU|nr:DUF397 domain-containing protein [Saccharothrix violaceirubra]MBB4969198.1 hypothetical protein [Saccharothrix violaceirubra]
MPSVDLSGAEWRKSSRSTGGTNANCVEVAPVGPVVAVRDSKNPQGTPLAFPAVQWAFFLERLGS